MTLILKLDLDIDKMYHHTKNEVSMPRHSKFIAQMDRQTHIHTDTHRQTDRQYENITFPHTRAVKMTKKIYNLPQQCAPATKVQKKI